jgi:hypothetical protein
VDVPQKQQPHGEGKGMNPYLPQRLPKPTRQQVICGKALQF